jgi:AI-2 transport protein TqsA
VTRSTSKVLIGLLSVIAVILGAGALKASAVVTMPLALAFFVAILVHPIERSLAAHLPAKLEWLGVACAMLAVVGALALAAALLSSTSGRCSSGRRNTAAGEPARVGSCAPYLTAPSAGARL